MLKLSLILCITVIAQVLYTSAAKVNCPPIKLKSQWGGKLAKDLTYQVRPIEYVIIHHTVSDECSTFVDCAEIVQNTQEYHLNSLDFDDIGYNFLVGGDGNIYEGTGWGVRGSHTYGYNMNGTGIAFIGNFIKKLPTRAAINAAKKLLQCGVSQGELHEDYRLLAGLQVSSTKSPGLTLYNEIQKWDHWVLNP